MRRATTFAVFALVAAACGSASVAGSPSSTVQAPSATTAPTTTGADTSQSAATAATTSRPPSSGAYPAPSSEVDEWVPEVLAILPHDPGAFTQGLLVRGDVVYESTGLYGQSSVRIVDRDTGVVVSSAPLADELFGEGLELVDDRLIQLTWQSEIAVVWDAATLQATATYDYSGEGWGLCDLGDRLAMSDGSATLTFRDRVTFEEEATVDVTLDGAPVERLNELECVDGLIFANVWQTSTIVVIDPGDGDVTAVVDASALTAIAGGEPPAVLNGIAYDAGNNVFLVTGKLWAEMFEVRFVDG